MELFAEYRAKEKLLDQLDQSLLNHAKSLSAGEGPGIADVYHLQSLAELHCYLKTVHQFDSAEVEALLKFADPMSGFHWQNPHRPRRKPLCGNVCVLPFRRPTVRRRRVMTTAAMSADRLFSPHELRGESDAGGSPF